MARLTEEELLDLIKGGETSTLELKVNPPRPGELAERICGLANARGGYIVMGVEDSTLAIKGVANIGDAFDVILRAARQVNPTIELVPPEPEVYLLDGKKLIVSYIPQSEGPVYQSGGVCWQRHGTHTVRMSVEEILKAANDRGRVSWEMKVADAAEWADIDETKVDAYLRRRQDRYRYDSRYANLTEVLVGMRCGKMVDGQFKPTNCGLLFFGKDPQMHLPHTEVVCVVYRDAYGIGSYIDRKNIIGTFQELIDQVAAFVNLYIPVGAKIEGWERVDMPELPLEILREAVVNAVIHRDYSREGERIRLFIYSDRVEVHSPGRLLPGVTTELMEQGRVSSKLRNPVLAGLLRDIPRYTEQIGSGIKLMLNESRRRGLPPPQFQELDEFIVTFRRTPAPLEAEITPIQEAPRRELRAVIPEALEREQRLVLAMIYIQENGYINNVEYRKLTGVSERVAARDLAELVSSGSLRALGKARSRQYRLP